MRHDREKCIKNIKVNVREIKEYLDLLSGDELSDIYKDMKDIFIFYGFNNSGSNFLVKYFISDDAIEEEVNLIELENITSALLFKLKYRHKQVG